MLLQTESMRYHFSVILWQPHKLGEIEVMTNYENHRPELQTQGVLSAHFYIVI